MKFVTIDAHLTKILLNKNIHDLTDTRAIKVNMKLTHYHSIEKAVIVEARIKQTAKNGQHSNSLPNRRAIYTYLDTTRADITSHVPY